MAAGQIRSTSAIIYTYISYSHKKRLPSIGLYFETRLSLACLAGFFSAPLHSASGAVSYIPGRFLARCARSTPSAKASTLSHLFPALRFQPTMSTKHSSTTTPRAKDDDWSAKQYAKFLNERTRPSRDLLAQVPLASPKRAIDLGCGPGNSTAVLAERYPDANISGIDSSEDMIRKAKETLPGLSFGIADLETFTPDEPVDLLFSNAVFQWLPGKTRVQTITRLVENLAPGGVLAFQVPNNLSEPSHVAMRDTAHAPDTPWAETLSRVNLGRDEFHTPSELHEALSPLCSDVDIWETRYFQTMESHEAIVEWVKGTGLRPFINPLSEAEREGYLKHYLVRIKELYPMQRDGTVLFPYPRLFVVATKA